MTTGRPWPPITLSADMSALFLYLFYTCGSYRADRGRLNVLLT